MSDSRLRARSATEIIDAAFAMYKGGFQQLVLASGLAYAPWLVIQLVIQAIWSPNVGGVTPGSVAQVSIPYVITNAVIGIGSLVTYTIMSGVIVVLGKQIYLEHPYNIPEALRQVWPRAMGLTWAALGRGIILFVAAALAGVAGGIIGFVAGALLGPTVGPVLGALLMFVAIVWATLFVFARYALVTPALIIENLPVSAAFQRSQVLATGRARHILAALLIMLLLLLLLYFGAVLTVVSLGSVVAATVIASVFVILAYPLYGLTEMLLYYDARIRGEGFDIEVLAGALGASAASERLAP